MAFPRDDYRLRAVWVRPSEPVAWIAEATESYLKGLADQFGVAGWADTYGGATWPDTQADRERAVEAKVSRDDEGRAWPRAGYHLDLSATGQATGVRVEVFAGYAGVGRNIPAHLVEVRCGYDPAAAVDGPMLDAIVPETVRVWAPVMVSFANRDLTRGDWGIPAAWRLWLRNDVGRFDTLAEGLSAVELDGGTLLRAPEEWTPEQVESAVGGTLEANGLTVLPFDEAAG